MKYFLTAILVIAPISLLEAQEYGQDDHPMNKNSDNRKILNYWNEKTQEVKEIYNSAYDILSKDKTATFADLFQNENFQKLSQENKILKLGGPMLGNLESNEVSIWIRTVKPSKVEVKVTSNEFNEKFGPIYSTAETDLTAVIPIDGLESQTHYSYEVIINDKVISNSEEFHFHTLPLSGYESTARISFGSCPHRWGLGNRELFNQIQGRNPNGLLLLGDIAVQDRNDHLGLHRADYLLRDFQPAWKNFVSSVPVYATWDDHDYFDNDLAGIPKEYTKSDKENVWKVFRHSWNNPSYGFGKEKKGVFLQTTVGPFDIIMTDNRYFRTGKKGSFLGAEQMEWLKKQLLNAESPFIILSCGTMWSDYVSDGKDSWGVNDPQGRDEILKFIEENNIKGVILISGDRHGARGFEIPRESGYTFYEFEAASLGARIGPPARKPEWKTQLYGIDGRFAFGEFTYVPSPTNPAVIYRLISEDGEIIYQQKLTRSQLTPKK